jgi:uncharacterized membrane protein
MPVKSKLSDAKRRSLAKTITYRLLNIFLDIIVVYPLTHRVDITTGVVIFTNVASTIGYFLHERAWSHIHWGKS